jgi:hypothetical protein
MTQHHTVHFIHNISCSFIAEYFNTDDLILNTIFTDEGTVFNMPTENKESFFIQFLL